MVESFEPAVGFRRLVSVGVTAMPFMTYEAIALDKIPNDQAVEKVP